MTRLIFIFAFALAGCSTLGEMASPNDTSTGYVKTKNRQGQTVYRRERYVGPGSPAYAAPVAPPVVWAADPEPYVPAPEPTPVPMQMPAVAPTPMPVTAAPPSAPAASTEFFGKTANVPPSDAVAPPPPSATPVESSERTWAWGVELASDRKHPHVGLDVYKKWDVFDKWGALEGKVGVSIFGGDTDTYAGLDLGLRPRFEVGNGIALFAGLGMYYGDSKHCSVDDDDMEYCEKKFLLAGYTEAGVDISWFSVFVRNYNIHEADKEIPSELFYGIGFHTSY